MSILQTIEAARQDGRVHVLEPRPKSAARIRSMYLADELRKELYAAGLSQAEIHRFAALEATLADFVTSRTIDPEYLKLLSPTTESIWEIRAVRPDPSMRVFGFFGARDLFIATNMELRKTLAEFDSTYWNLHKTTAKNRWKKICFDYEPRKETDAKLLVTGALDGQYFK